VNAEPTTLILLGREYDLSVSEACARTTGTTVAGAFLLSPRFFPFLSFTAMTVLIPSLRSPYSHGPTLDKQGKYKPVAPGHAYPPNLANYSDYGEGWMNEEGTRIDMVR